MLFSLQTGPPPQIHWGLQLCPHIPPVQQGLQRLSGGCSMHSPPVLSVCRCTCVILCAVAVLCVGCTHVSSSPSMLGFAHLSSCRLFLVETCPPFFCMFRGCILSSQFFRRINKATQFFHHCKQFSYIRSAIYLISLCHWQHYGFFLVIYLCNW